MIGADVTVVGGTIGLAVFNGGSKGAVVGVTIGADVTIVGGTIGLAVFTGGINGANVVIAIGADVTVIGGRDNIGAAEVIVGAGSDDVVGMGATVSGLPPSWHRTYTGICGCDDIDILPIPFPLVDG